MKNAALQALILNIFFLFVFALFWYFGLSSRIQNITEKKVTLEQVYNDNQKLTTSGPDWALVKASASELGLSKSSYTRGLLRNISDPFFLQYFTNTGSITYLEYLDEVEGSIIEIKNSEDYIKKQEMLDTLLPIYTKSTWFSNSQLSDFYFVNYVEKLLYSFNLSSKGEIGVGRMSVYDTQNNTQKSKSAEDSLDEKIYSIPLSFTLEGAKWDIVNFLHFLENVGSVSIDENDLLVYKDSFLPTVIEGEDGGLFYNVYEHQITEIDTITLGEYPDSSSWVQGSEDLIARIKSSQSREKYSVEISMVFYVTGYPGYKMNEAIEDTIALYKELSASISASAQKYTAQIQNLQGDKIAAVQKLQNYDSLLVFLATDMKQLEQSYAKQENIEENYETAQMLYKRISQIQEEYNVQIALLELKN